MLIFEPSPVPGEGFFCDDVRFGLWNGVKNAGQIDWM